MSLASLAVILGLSYGLPNVYGLVKPVEFGAALRKFPRYTPAGYLLILVATIWFLVNLGRENISDFVSLKPVFYLLFGIVGVGSCLFLKDFLSVRGLAVVLLLLAKLMVDTARWADSQWRIVIVTWAYLWVLAGIWFTISPWRLRDLINWSTATQQRTRLFSALRLGFGLFVAFLGFAVFKRL